MMHPSRRAYVEEAEDEDRGMDLDSVPIDRDYDIPATATGLAPEKASAILAQLERKKLAATIVVPTDDAKVRARLRELGEPVTLFGEDYADRRARLRELLTVEAEQGAEAKDEEMEDVDEAEEEAEEQEEEFYTAGSPELLAARKEIAHYSLPRAKRRIAFQQAESKIPLRTHVKFRKTVKERLQHFELQASQPAGDRNVSITRFSPNQELIATGNFGGQVALYGVSDLEKMKTFRGHTSKISGLAWFPGSTLTSSGVSPESVNLASGGAEGQVHLWSLDKDTPIQSLSGHSQRVCRVEFHPSGKYLASASEDTSWRLWDVATGTELLLQEGHSSGVYAVSFNTDGSLLASAGLDSIGRIWDLRTGRTIMILEQDGHIKPIYALDWGSDGHRVLTGSADGWVKCWDVRKVQRTGGLGAHSSAVSDVRWFKGLDDPLLGTPPAVDEKGSMQPKKSGTFFVTSGFDQKVNIYSADDWVPIQSLSGHTGPVSSVDVSQNGQYIVSGGHDKTIKLWGREDGEPL